MIDTRVVISEAIDVAEARRLAAHLAIGLGFSEHDVGRVALVVTEAATNLRKHAQGGEILLSAVTTNGVPVIDVRALDRGPGIPDLAQSLGDGYSTAGSPGTGLGAIGRIADAFDVLSSDAGTALFASMRSRPKAPRPPRTNAVSPLVVGAVCVPQPGESVSGDGWAVRETERGLIVLLVDGLGHGPDAAAAAAAALTAFQELHTDSLVELMKAMHETLRGTRGAAVALAALDRVAGTIRYVGIGNIGARFEGLSRPSRALVSMEGTAGYAIRRVREFTYEWPAGPGLLVMHTDGLVTRWTLNGYRGVFNRDPALVAGLLYRDFWRGRDDVTVVVVKRAETSGE